MEEDDEKESLERKRLPPIDMEKEEEALFSRLKSDYSCGICLSILDKAVATPCGHLFCGNCLHGWEQSIFPDVNCPKCRRPFKMEDTIRMYSNSSLDKDQRISLTKQQRKRLEHAVPRQSNRVGRLFVYESEFSDMLSSKSAVTLITLCFFGILTITWMFQL